MSPRFHADDIDRLQETASIVEVIGEHVRLRKAGRNFKGLCPFHQEKTPSLSVDPDKGVYYCFGCGAGGSVFTFVEQIEGLSFPEAVEALARRYSVEMRQMEGSQKRGPSKRTRLYELHELAVAKYWELLAASEAVMAYLTDRGIGSEAIERYSIGFGGWRRDALVRSLLRRGFKGDELLAGGVATRDGRALRDTFHGRLVFPIFDPAGRAVGFGGRVLPDDVRQPEAPDGPKYLNSRQSEIFNKSKLLYGTNWARPDVLQAKRLVLVEGYTDVIAMHAGGFGETVATCGTSLTEDHMKEIARRFGDVRVVLCLDGDAAGQAAVSRDRTEELAGKFAPGEAVAGGWLPVGKGWLPEVYVAELPDGKDPADAINDVGTEAVGTALEASRSLIEFLLRRSLDGAELNTPDGRAVAVRRGIDVLGQVGDQLMRHEYALWLADRAGVDAAEVSKALQERGREPAKRRRSSGPEAPVQVVLSGHHRVEREALRAVITRPEFLEEPELGPAEEDLSLPLHRSVFRLLRAELDAAGEVDLARFVSRVQDADIRKVISELSVGEAVSDQVARDTLRRLKAFTIERHIMERKERLRSLDPEGDAATYDALFEELLELEKQKRALGEGDA